MLNTYHEDILMLKEDGNITAFGQPFKGKILYSGGVDDLLHNEMDHLPYRSLRFEFENHQQEVYQPAAVVNYPNNFDFTRITEFKHLTQQKAASTTIMKEYPIEGDGCNEFYYPIPSESAREDYDRYVDKLKTVYGEKIVLIGRAGLYRYYNMDQIILNTMETIENL